MNANEATTETESVRPCAIERAARAWEETAKEILRKVPRDVSVGDRTRYDQQVTYCAARAAGLREALIILGDEYRDGRMSTSQRAAIERAALLWTRNRKEEP
jgi:hypothetical protein